jgi:hypothetical protein
LLEGLKQTILNIMDRQVEVEAFDFSLASLALAREKGISRVRQLDLVDAEEIPSTSDVCVCLEVAEHLPASAAPKLARILSRVAPVLIFTAAPPGQGGHFHINEQPRQYWVKLFQEAGMQFSSYHVNLFKAHYQGQMIRDYDDNLMIFTRVS